MKDQRVGSIAVGCTEAGTVLRLQLQDHGKVLVNVLGASGGITARIRLRADVRHEPSGAGPQPARVEK